MKYPLLLAGIAATMSLIPIFGSILSSVPIVAIALISSGTFDLRQGVFVLAWIIGIHLVEANLLNPKIMGDAAKIHPVLVVFALIAGEHSYGLVGALFAVPGRLDHPDDLHLLPPAPAARRRRRRRRRARRAERRTVERAQGRVRATRTVGLPVGADDQRRAIGDVVPAGPRRDVAVRLDDHGAQRLVRDRGARCARRCVVARPWQTGQSEIPSTCR